MNYLTWHQRCRRAKAVSLLLLSAQCAAEHTVGAQELSSKKKKIKAVFSIALKVYVPVSINAYNIYLQKGNINKPI